MTISIVVHLQAKSALHTRHLLRSLEAQQGVDTEILLFCSSDINQLPKLPESWKTHQLEPNTSSFDVWTKGLELSSGEHIAFFQTSVVLHPYHLACCLNELESQSADAIFAQPQFIDQELFPIIGAGLPVPESGDWPGVCLASKLLWPLESGIFKKTALLSEPVGGFSERPFVGDFLIWIKTHQVHVLALNTLSVPFEGSLLSDYDQMQETFIDSLLKTYSEPELLPGFAASGNEAKIAQEAYTYICQAFRNHKLFERLEDFQRKHLDYAALDSVMWLTYADKNAYLPLLEEINEQGIQPIIIVASESPSADGSQYALDFTQEKGLIMARISGIPEHEQDVLLLDNLPGVVQVVFDLLSTYRPARIHLTSFNLYSSYLPKYLAYTNTPIYYSVTDKSALLARQYLNFPETLTEEKKYASSVLQLQSELIETFLRDSVAAILIHQIEDKDRFIQSGFNQEQLSDISTADALFGLYQKQVSITRPVTPGSALPLLFQKSTGQSLEDHLAEDMRGIQSDDRVLVFGHDISDFLNRLVGQQIWAYGTVYSDEDARIYQEQGLPVSVGSINNLSFHTHYYHRLYSSFALEDLYYQDLRRLLTGVVLSLQKYGRWFLRLMQPRLSGRGREEFWLSENHRRPYSATLIKEILKHAGFSVSSEVHGGEPFCDVSLEAELRTESLPLLNMPTASKNFISYWEAHPPSVGMDEQEKVLLLGSHIRKTWLMYRVQCEEMHGITLSLSELGAKPQKTKSKHHFRHARDILRTLQLNCEKYDLILIQGLFETLLPQQVHEFLELCRTHLNESGRLYIQTLNLEMDQDDPLFWQSALNVRPYHNLEGVLQEHGFAITDQHVDDKLSIYQCHFSETVEKQVITTELPNAIQALTPAGVTPTVVHSYDAFLQLKPDTQDCLVLKEVLEQVPAGQIGRFMQHVHQVLKPNSLFILWCLSVDDWNWEQTEVLRPYPAKLVDKLLQDNGLQKRSLLEHEGYTIWSGYNRLNLKTKNKQELKISWEGDALNYHSLSVVNRELLKELLSQKNCEIEIHNLSDPNYIPEPNSSDFPILQHMNKALSGQPNLVLRHSWPPNFSLPHTGGHWVMIQPWEFGSLPERWVYNINKFLDQVWVPSHFVKESYLRSGVLPEKVAVVPNGVDTDTFTPHAPALVLPTEKTFKFLFVGGGILRKGVDLLLNAFVDVFTDQDDVALVVKEFGAGKVYKTIEIAEWIERYRRDHENVPEIIHLNEDLPGDQMVALYNAVDCLVHPYRAEGFALPIAEAMACEKPVLVTDYGACLDYCNADNAYLLPAQEVPFKEKQIDNTLVTVDYPYWAEPDYEALKALLRHIYENQKEAQKKGLRGRETIQRQFTWRHAVLSLEARLETLLQKPVFRFYRQHLIATTLGQAFEQLEFGVYADAIEHFQKVLQIDPHQPSVAYNIGVAYLMQQDYNESLEYLTRSLREGEITADLCYAMGTTLRHLGDYPTSQEFFRKARDLDPSLFDVSEDILSEPALANTGDTV